MEAARPGAARAHRADEALQDREDGTVPPRILRMCALAVSCSANCPAPVGMRRSAPASSSSATTGAWLRLQAQCRHVLRGDAAPSEPAGRSAHGAGSPHGSSRGKVPSTRLERRSAPTVLRIPRAATLSGPRVAPAPLSGSAAQEGGSASRRGAESRSSGTARRNPARPRPAPPRSSPAVDLVAGVDVRPRRQQPLHFLGVPERRRLPQPLLQLLRAAAHRLSRARTSPGAAAPPAAADPVTGTRCYARPPPLRSAPLRRVSAAMLCAGPRVAVRPGRAVTAAREGSRPGGTRRCGAPRADRAPSRPIARGRRRGAGRKPTGFLSGGKSSRGQRHSSERSLRTTPRGAAAPRGRSWTAAHRQGSERHRRAARTARLRRGYTTRCSLQSRDPLPQEGPQKSIGTQHSRPPPLAFLPVFVP